MKKKSFLPKDTRELENTYYGKGYSERKKKYESYTDSKIINPIREGQAKELLKNFGESCKISTLSVQAKRTPDYEINKSKIVYEITSIQISEDEKITQKVRPRSEQDFVEDVNNAIEHALEKDYSNYQDHLKGIIIFADEILTSLTDYNQYSTNTSLIKQTIFTKSNIDFMILAPTPHSTNKQLECVVYVKDDKLYKMFEDKLPKEFKIIRI